MLLCVALETQISWMDLIMPLLLFEVGIVVLLLVYEEEEKADAMGKFNLCDPTRDR